MYWLRSTTRMPESGPFLTTLLGTFGPGRLAVKIRRALFLQRSDAFFHIFAHKSKQLEGDRRIERGVSGHAQPLIERLLCPLLRLRRAISEFFGDAHGGRHQLFVRDDLTNKT